MGEHKTERTQQLHEAVRRYTVVNQAGRAISGITSTTSSGIVWSSVTDGHGVVVLDRKDGGLKKDDDPPRGRGLL